MWIVNFSFSGKYYIRSSLQNNRFGKSFFVVIDYSSSFWQIAIATVQVHAIPYNFGKIQRRVVIFLFIIRMFNFFWCVQTFVHTCRYIDTTPISAGTGPDLRFQQIQNISELFGTSVLKQCRPLIQSVKAMLLYDSDDDPLVAAAKVY